MCARNAHISMHPSGNRPAAVPRFRRYYKRRCRSQRSRRMMGLGVPYITAAWIELWNNTPTCTAGEFKEVPPEYGALQLNQRSEAMKTILSALVALSVIAG